MVNVTGTIEVLLRYRTDYPLRRKTYPFKPNDSNIGCVTGVKKGDPLFDQLLSMVETDEGDPVFYSGSSKYCDHVESISTDGNRMHIKYYERNAIPSDPVVTLDCNHMPIKKLIYLLNYLDPPFLYNTLLEKTSFCEEYDITEYDHDEYFLLVDSINDAFGQILCPNSECVNTDIVEYIMCNFTSIG